jgi:DNA-binding response OmpR family regulator
MGSACPLTGRSILVVEDEPLIALDIAEGLKAAGASVLAAHSLTDAMRMAADPDLSAAVLDFSLRDGDGSALCDRLKEREIPFVLHTGHAHVEAPVSLGVVVRKPAAPADLVNALASLLQGRHA